MKSINDNPFVEYHRRNILTLIAEIQNVLTVEKNPTWMIVNLYKFTRKIDDEIREMDHEIEFTERDK